MSWIVLKFGGTSVGSAEAMLQAARIVRDRAREGQRVAVVVSALSKVTDTLDRLIGSREEDVRNTVSELWLRHRRQLHTLGAPRSAIERAEEKLRSSFLALTALFPDVGPVPPVDPRIRAAWLARGEELSSVLFEAALAAVGSSCTRVDPRELLVARGQPLDATPDLPASTKRVASRLRGLDTRALLVPGFYAGDPAGSLVLLGRGGSDTAATALAYALGAETCEIFTDVDGVAPSDPRSASGGTFFYRRLSYDQAEALAALGAKVLHAKSLAPVREGRIPLRVANTFRPEAPGTWIGPAECRSAAGRARLLSLSGAWA